MATAPAISAQKARLRSVAVQKVFEATGGSVEGGGRRSRVARKPTGSTIVAHRAKIAAATANPLRPKAAAIGWVEEATTIPARLANIIRPPASFERSAPLDVSRALSAR